MLGELDRDARERLELLESRSASLEVARPEPRGDELLEQCGLTSGGGTERAQVPRIEPVTRETTARSCDLDVARRLEEYDLVSPRIEAGARRRA